MKHKLSLLIIFISFSFASFSQQLPFTNINATLEGLGFSNAAWGDFDNDGDLDVALTGEPGSTKPVTKIYRNDNGSFADYNATLPGFTYSSVEWGDFDNDSDLDLLITGNDSLGNPATKIFRNDNGTFSDINANLPAIWQGSATWGDFDNDNDLDILLAGNLQAKIMRNDGNNQFMDIGSDLPFVQSAFCNWVDYNNDGWLDAMVGGDLGGIYVAKLFRNNHGLFEEDSAEFMGLSAGCAKWGDLNNDGKKDLVLGGMDPNLLGHYVIYKNNGDGQFEFIDNYSFNLLAPSFDLGDFDNDGYLDIILIGRIQGCGGAALTLLYHNDGAFILSDVSTEIHGFRNGSVAWGDYNNDGSADLLFTGIDGYDEQRTEIYINNAGSGIFTVNTKPSVPGNLEAIVTGDNVQLRWNKTSDEQTPSDGLSYNIFIGASPDVADIMNPLSDLMTGFRKVALLGNTNKDTTWGIQGLNAGDYYWRVQAVDNGFLGSGFATSQSFEVNPVGLTITTSSSPEFYPNPFDNALFIRNIDPSLKGSIRITDALGRIVYTSSSITSSIDLSSLSKGVYFIYIRTPDSLYFSKLIKKD
jgi:hypothetical protein